MFFINNHNIKDPRLNLAFEEYCLRNLDTDSEYLLFYINEPSIIVGRNQNTWEEINHDYVHEESIHVIRRISGGGAVYHDHGNLNFSFITRYDEKSVLNFRKFTAPVIKVLTQLGVPAELTGRNDIVVEGRKISGNAQYSTNKNMFSHGTLLFDSEIEKLDKALNVKQDKIESKGLKSVKNRVANISEYLQIPFDIESFRNHLLEMIFEPYGRIKEHVLTDKDWQNIHRLAEEKYSSWNWNYGESPKFNIQKIDRFDIGQIDARIEVENGIINNIKFYGDFLGHGNIGKLESKLTGIPYDADKIRNALYTIDLNHYFGEITLDNFVNYLI